VRAGGTVLLTALATVSLRLSEASMDGGTEPQSPPWQQAPEWTAYKQLHAAASSPKTLSEMEAVEARIRRESTALRRLFPGNTELATDLAAFLFDAAHLRRTELQKPRGRPARPDVNAQLDDLLDRLDQRFSTLRRLHEVGGTDPWIAAEVEALVVHSIEAAEDTLKRIDRKQPDASALTQRTKETVSRVRAWLKVSGTRG
jgi:hypothetical protein